MDSVIWDFPAEMPEMGNNFCPLSQVYVIINLNFIIGMRWDRKSVFPNELSQ